MSRESMEFDVVIVGAGPAGLSTACRLAQIAKEKKQEVSIAVIEKGSEVGAHILSGAILEPRALDELFPDWRERGAPINVPVGDDEVFFFTKSHAIKVPSIFVPKPSHNKGNYIVSLGNVCRWLAELAEQLDVAIFPGFSATEILYRDDGTVYGVATGDIGVDKEGEKKEGFTPGTELHAKYTVLSEGCRGSLGKEIVSKFNLNKNRDPQHYGLGIKEIWEISPDKHNLGQVMHNIGWPLSETKSGSGSFLYHLDNNQVSLGLFTDLSYSNPYLSPFEEMQRWKTHPKIKSILTDGRRISYGARAVIKGGVQALPKMSFPGGVLVGCDAGTLNMAKIKGIHTGMKSGMVAAEVIFEALAKGDANTDLTNFDVLFKKSWAYEELYSARNVNPALHKFGMLLGAAYTFVDQEIFKGKLPWTLRDTIPDHETLKLAKDSKKVEYPKPDGVITFSRNDSVYLSNTNHADNQLCHLKLKDPLTPISINLPKWDEPAQRYCPAGVYEIITDEDGNDEFQINSQNCVHCKTCDIKDPSQNIDWAPPEGGGGPNYPNM